MDSSWLLSSSSSLVSLSFLFMVLAMIPLSLCYEDLFSSCRDSRFSCGNINDIGFPFWGEKRPDGCGYPGLKLNCDRSVATIEIMNVTYRVLDVNPNTQTIKISREDYLTGICSPEYVNSTLDPILFDFSPGYQNLTLFYGCSTSSIFSVTVTFTCHVNGNVQMELVAGLIPNIDNECNQSVVIPVSTLGNLMDIGITKSKLEEIIREGFEVKWKVDSTECSDCVGLKGVCGYDLKLNQPTCYYSPVKPVPSVHAADDQGQRYDNCSATFACATISDLSYPFWGSNRPDYCGYPGFQLNCSGDVPLLNVTDMYYRVFEINSAARSLKVARLDYWNTICPATYANTTVDRSTLFSHTPATNNLTLYYQCLASSPLFTTQTTEGFSFTCDGNGNEVTGYYSRSSLAADAINNLLGLCEKNVKVPVSTEPSSLTAEEAVREAIDGGFTLDWNANNSMCDRCEGSGGQCGFNTSTNAFACHCKTGSFPETCGSDGKKNEVSLGVGIGIGGAGIVGIFLGFWIFSIRQRKKKRAEEAKIKELPITPPSSKGVPDSSTNLYQSTPSYSHSKSDLEKGSTYFGAHIFSYAELEEATNNFDPSRELGDGGFGTVYYGKLHDGRVVAVKRLYENNFKRVEQFMNEVIILTRLRHKNLVTLYGCTSKRSQGLLLVYEYISNGTVADHLNGNKSSTGSLTWPIRLSIAIESAEALNFLHQSDVIHRDVKTNNILLDENFCVKVADFGLSRLFPTDVTHVSTAPQGTPGYVDPEYYQCYQLTNKSDVYSFGVVLIELISSLPAVDTNRHRHDINLASMAINKIQNHTLHELVDPSLGFEKDHAVRRMTTSVAELAFRCLQQERDMRPKMDEVLEILKRIKNEEMGEEKAEVVDIRVDDVGHLKNIPPPLSPDSVVTGKWVSDSTNANSF